ncbi:MAG: hypothetical protein ACREBV_04330 [Candidatus Zixiibacteriota bacterium]
MFDPDKTATMGSSKDTKFDEFASPTKNKTSNAPAKLSLVIDDSKSKMLLQQLRDNQNLTMAFVGGLGAAALCRLGNYHRADLLPNWLYGHRCRIFGRLRRS